MSRTAPSIPSPTNLERLQKSFFNLALLVLVVLVLHSAKAVLVPVARSMRASVEPPGAV